MLALDWVRSKIFLLGLGKRLGLTLVLIAVYCTIVQVVLRIVTVPELPAEWGIEVSLVNGLIVGLLLGLRNRSSLDRWWQGRNLWGQLVNDSRNLALKLRNWLPAEALSRGRLPEVLIGFPVALKQHLRGGVLLQEVPGFKDDPETPGHVPLYLAGRVFEQLATWQREGLIDPVTTLMLDAHARGLMDVCGACEKIRHTPLPFSYKGMLRLGILLNILVSPWFVLAELGPWGILAFLLVCFFLLGIEMVDTVLEEPFGTDADDLKLDRYCRTIQDSVEEVFNPRERAPADRRVTAPTET